MCLYTCMESADTISPVKPMRQPNGSFVFLRPSGPLNMINGLLHKHHYTILLNFFFQFPFGHGYNRRSSMRTVIWILQRQKFLDQRLNLRCRQSLISLYSSLAGQGCNLLIDQLRCHGRIQTIRYIIQHFQQQFFFCNGKQIVRYCPYRIFISAEGLSISKPILSKRPCGGSKFLLSAWSDQYDRWTDHLKCIPCFFISASVLS